MKLLGGIVLVLGMFAAGCSKSTCEKYADMEIKCGNIPEKEADMTRALARGMCEASSSNKDELKEMGDMIKKEADCAAKTTDCAEYKKCTEAVK